jgi:hypothetical protein
MAPNTTIYSSPRSVLAEGVFVDAEKVGGGMEKVGGERDLGVGRCLWAIGRQSTSTAFPSNASHCSSKVVFRSVVASKAVLRSVGGLQVDDGGPMDPRQLNGVPWIKPT